MKRNLATAYVLFCISLLVAFFSCPNLSPIVWNSELEISTDSGRLARRSVERYAVWKYEVDMKRIYHFQEDSDEPIVGTLYVQKSAFSPDPRGLRPP